MRRFTFSLVIMLFISSSVRCQEADNTELFKNYGFEKANRIIKDSIWIKKQLWKKSGLTSLQEAEKVEFIIIPIFSLADSAPNYKGDKSLINYLKSDEIFLSAFVTYKDAFIGYIKIYFSEIYEKEKQDFKFSKTDDIINYLNGTNRKIIGYAWIISYETEFGKSQTHFNHLKAFYNTIKVHNPKYFFMFPIYGWELWFVEDNKLKANSIFYENIVDEKELIKGIRKTEVDGNIQYYLEYRKKE